MERSVLPAVIVVPAVEELFAPFGSVDVVVTLAGLFSVPSGADGEAVATMVNVAVAPEARLALVQVIVPFVPTVGLLQLKAGPVFCASETKVVLAGSASVSDTLVAG